MVLPTLAAWSIATLTFAGEFFKFGKFLRRTILGSIVHGQFDKDNVTSQNIERSVNMSTETLKGSSADQNHNALGRSLLNHVLQNMHYEVEVHIATSPPKDPL